MKKRFNLIIFDWDGTLIDSIDWIVRSLQYAAESCFLPIPEKQAAREVIGLSIDTAMAALFPKIDRNTGKTLVQYYNDAYYSRKLGREDLFPGVYDMLVKLNEAGYRIAVATGKTRKGLNHALAATGTQDLFATTRCADESASKPDPAMLMDIMRSINVPHSDALMVGDTAHDLEMAQNAGISSVAVTCGAHPKQLLKPYQPLTCLHQPAELLNFIEG